MDSVRQGGVVVCKVGTQPLSLGSFKKFDILVCISDRLRTDSLARPQYGACSFNAETIASNWSSGFSACVRKEFTNSTRAATHVPQMKSGEEDERKPRSLATRHRSATARAEDMQVVP